MPFTKAFRECIQAKVLADLTCSFAVLDMRARWLDGMSMATSILFFGTE